MRSTQTSFSQVPAGLHTVEGERHSTLNRLSRAVPLCLSRGSRAAAQRRQDLRERLQLDRYATPPPSDGEAPAAGAPAPARVSEYAAGELRTTVTVAPISLYRRAPRGLCL